MSQMRVPVTDAFDETDQLQSLEVELTPRQIEWLEQRAEERGLSLDHMLRSVITARIRGTDETAASASTGGDGVPESSGSDASPSVRVPSSDADEEEDAPSIVESLRAASERLQDLTDKETTPTTEDTSDLRDTIDRLQDRIETSTDEEAASEEASSGDSSDDGVVQDSGRSMFDMVEE